MRKITGKKVHMKIFEKVVTVGSWKAVRWGLDGVACLEKYPLRLDAFLRQNVRLSRAAATRKEEGLGRFV